MAGFLLLFLYNVFIRCLHAWWQASLLSGRQRLIPEPTTASTAYTTIATARPFYLPPAGPDVCSSHAAGMSATHDVTTSVKPYTGGDRDAERTYVPELRVDRGVFHDQAAVFYSRATMRHS
ncbi:hypothetical protein GE09DRAFT_1068345 [Coniochaeta sp. 2T2.1]|nr:hypothetical protein GE09DRAFT_1068345 [Coniochaeta sp. 2T2.1]